jgi:carbon monoxide dehydrogenase subunit G
MPVETPMRIEQTFTVARPPDDVFDYLTDPSKVAECPRRVHTHIVEGPYPVDGTWSFESDGAGTRIQFVAEGQLTGAMRLLGPFAARLIARQFRGYHENLRRNLEAG